MAQCTFVELERLMMKCHYREFQDKYRKVYYDLLMKREPYPSFVEIDTEIYRKAMAIYSYIKEDELKLEKTTFYNNLGSSLEKEKKIEEAIKAYEDCAAIGYQADHCYERLRILYKKLKRFNDMERIIARKKEVYSRPKRWEEEEIDRYFRK